MEGKGSLVNALPPFQWALLATLLFAVILANLDQPYPELAPLQHAPTLALVVAAPWSLRRWPLSNGRVFMLWLFLLLHTLGGRYIYSYVPYDGWFATLTGQPLSALLGLERNAYDRLIHFLFGLLITPVFAEVSQRHGSLGRRSAWLLAFAFIGLISAMYEVFEWLLTLALADGTADYYNGQQGDIWDPQKDMAIAQVGAALACAGACLRRSTR